MKQLIDKLLIRESDEYPAYWKGMGWYLCGDIWKNDFICCDDFY